MIKLVLGGSGSGKSAFAEQQAMELSGEKEICYLATMQVYGEEGQKKVERHRKLRAGKHFFTIEKQRNIEEAAEEIRAYGNTVPERPGILLECMSNLVANEMFPGTEIRSEKAVVRHIMNSIEQLRREVPFLVIVSGNVFEDGDGYDATTIEYRKALGEVNCYLAELSDEVTELVVGIPVSLKKK